MKSRYLGLDQTIVEECYRETGVYDFNFKKNMAEVKEFAPSRQSTGP